MIKSIESFDNPVFKVLKSLLNSKGIETHQEFLVFGKKPISDTLTTLTTSQIPYYFVGLQKHTPIMEALPKIETPNAKKSLVLSNELFKEINLFAVDYPILVTKTPTFPSWKLCADKVQMILPLQNPSNLGAALRSLMGFGVRAILTTESANPLHPQAIRALSGNIFQADLLLGPSLQELPENLSYLVLDTSGQDITQFEFSDLPTFLMGQEGPGIPESILKNPRLQKLRIPIGNGIESLSAPMAVALAAFQYRRIHP